MLNVLLLGLFVSAPSVPSHDVASGGLRREAATLELALDVYRLALVELTPIAQRLVELDTQANVLPTDSVHQPMQEVFGRLASEVYARVPTELMTPVPRGHHLEVVDALERASEAQQLKHLPLVFHDLRRGIAGMVAYGEQLLALHQRRRPIQVRLVDEDQALRDIAASIESVASAEQQIARLRKRGAPLGRQLQAFLRLDITLSRALDLIAAAEDAGFKIGFDVQLDTTVFARNLNRVGVQVDGLGYALTQIGQGPGRLDSVQPLGWVAQGELFLAWNAQSAPRLGGWRVRKRIDRAGLIDALAGAHQCDGLSPSEAAAKAEMSLQDVVSEWDDMGVVAPGRSNFQTKLAPEDILLVPPVIELTAVSRLGAGGQTWEIAPLVLGQGGGVSQVDATAEDAQGASNTYYSLDATHLSWKPSHFDWVAHPEWTRIAERLGANPPKVAEYEITRSDTSGSVARVASGTTAWVDHPPAQALGRGLVYEVRALDAQGKPIDTSNDCRQAAVQSNAHRRLVLAQVGGHALTRPTTWERNAIARLNEPEAYEHSMKAFSELGFAQQVRAFDHYWRGLSNDAQQKLYESLRSPEVVAQLPPLRLSDVIRDDKDWVRLSMWLRTQSPLLSREADRFWALLPEASRATARQRFRRWSASRAIATVDPVKLNAWWEGLEPDQQGVVHEWWGSQSGDEKSARFESWSSFLSGDERRMLKWPAYDRVNEAEVFLKLQEILGTGLPEVMRPFLAWRAWEALSGPELVTAIQKEVSVPVRIWNEVIYRLRPLDKRLGFNLPWVLATSVLLTFGLLAVWRVRKRNPNAPSQPTVPTSASLS